MTISTSLAEYCSGIRPGDIPPDAMEAARAQILDTLGVGLAGARADGIPELVKVSRQMGGRRQACVIGHGLRLPAPQAAQINASMIHARDFDDGHPGALMHPAVIVVSAALAAAEMTGTVSGEELLAAVAVGTDLLCRMGLAVQSDVPRSVTGWHFTSVFGYPAGAAVTARLLRLSPEETANAMAIAYHQSAGNLQCAYDGALTKRLGPGFAVRGGMLSALLAAEGVTGASGWLEGNAGLYQQYFRQPCDDGALLSGLGSHFEGVNAGIKRYPCCGIVHPFIDAALEIYRQAAPDAGDIREVRVYFGEGTRYLVEPLEAKRQPRNIVDSQFSVPWAVAAALRHGRVVLDHFTEQGLANADNRSLAARITPVPDAGMQRPGGLDAGRVEVWLRGGKSLAATADNRMNHGGGRLSFDDCATKFYECAEFSGLGYSAEKLESLVEMVAGLEDLADAAVIARAMQPGAGAARI